MDKTKSSGTTRFRSWYLNGLLFYGCSSLNLRSERDEELSVLQHEIKKAYTLKALNAQLAEQKAQQMAMDIQIRVRDMIEGCRTQFELKENDRIEESKRVRRGTEMRAKLMEQVDEKHQKQIVIQEEACQERKVLHEIDRVREERDECERLKKKEQLAEQLFFEMFMQQEIREVDKRKLKDLEAKESSKNYKYTKQLEERTERLQRLRVEARKKREELICTVAEMLLNLQMEKDERDRLLTALVIEDVKRDAEISATQAELHQSQKMEEFVQQLDKQIEFEKECRRHFLKQEKDFADAVMDKISESNKMEQVTAEVRKRRKVEYRHVLNRLIEERERTRMENLTRLYHSLKEKIRKENAAKEKARAARIILLQQHVENIADFMSKKSLYEKELEVLDNIRKNK